MRLFRLSTLILVLLLLYSACEDENPVNNNYDPQNGKTVLFVANYSDGAGNLSFINLENDEITFAAAGLGDSPNDMVIYEDKLYVINSLSNDMNVFEITSENQLVPLEIYDLGRDRGCIPQFGDVAPNEKLYITNNMEDSVTVFNLSTNQIETRIPVGKYSSDVKVVGQKVYVCNTEFDPETFTYDQGTITIINTGSNTVQATVNVPMNPQFLTTDRNDNLHIVCTGNYMDIEGQVAILNTQVDSILYSIPLGGKPSQITINKDDIAFVTAYGDWGADNPGYVLKYNALTWEIINDSNNPLEVSNGALRIVSGPEGEVYISCFGADKIERMEGSTVVMSFDIGDGPTPIIIYNH